MVLSAAKELEYSKLDSSLIHYILIRWLSSFRLKPIECKLCIGCQKLHMFMTALQLQVVILPHIVQLVLNMALQHAVFRWRRWPQAGGGSHFLKMKSQIF